MQKTIDRPLLIILVILMFVGFFIFCSASLGLLARDGAKLSTVAFNQILFGIVGGTIALIITTNINYRFWRKYAFYIMGASLLMTLLVFTPLGMAHGGARRWIALGSFSFQPTEFLKFAFIIYVATWLSGMQKFITTFKKGLLPFGGIIVVVGVIMLAQPDTDTFAVMTMSAIAMFITAGGKWRDMCIAGAIGLVLFAGLVFERPYLMDRVKTFVDPSADQQGKSWQVKQSLIAIGSGGFAGRGFGQSIQKFEYLPEPTSDSIFAVLGEEFGFIGTTLLVILYSLFLLRSFKLAAEASDLFGMLLIVGFSMVIVLQAFLNIAAMLALFPLSGLPLPFVSHGGTALLASLASVGVMLNISRYRKRHTIKKV